MLTRFPHYLATLRAERDALEASFRVRIRDAMDNGTKADVAAMADTCWAEAGATERRWADAAGTLPTGKSPAGKSPFDTAWREMSALAAVV